MSAQLKVRGYHVGRRKAGRYMNGMDISNLSKDESFQADAAGKSMPLSFS